MDASSPVPPNRPHAVWLAMQEIETLASALQIGKTQFNLFAVRQQAGHDSMENSFESSAFAGHFAICPRAFSFGVWY
eukprot:3387433-Rhodomonas_salina.1